MRPRLPLRLRWRELPPVAVCGSSPAPEAHGRTVTVDPVVCRGRDEGTETFRGRRAHRDRSRPSSRARRSHLDPGVVPPRVRGTSRRPSRQDRWPSDHCAKRTRRQTGENPRSAVVYPLTTGALIRVRLGCSRTSLLTTWLFALLDVSPTPRRSPVPPYRITLSAWKRSPEGMVRPSAWAVFRLMTNSNVAGCSTGRSAG
jgi:hypothetical protein